MKKVLVIDAAGFSGIFVMEFFTRQGYLVRPLSCNKKLGKSGTLAEPAILSQIGYFRQ